MSDRWDDPVFERVGYVDENGRIHWTAEPPTEGEGDSIRPDGGGVA